MSSVKQFFQKLNKPLAAQAILVILFLAACFWIAMQPNPFEPSKAPPPQSGQVAPPDPTQLAMKATEFQAEVEENRDQTLGILLGGSILVVLVIGSTLVVMNRP